MEAFFGAGSSKMIHRFQQTWFWLQQHPAPLHKLVVVTLQLTVLTLQLAAVAGSSKNQVQLQLLHQWLLHLCAPAN